MRAINSETRGRRAMLVVGLVGAALLLAGARARAQERYRLDEQGWQQQQPPAPGTPEAALAQVRRLLAEGRAKEARVQAADWIEAHPNHPLLAEAHLLRGDALAGLRDYYNALFDYEVVLRQFSGSPQFAIALEREYEIARLFSQGMRRSLWGLRILSAYGEAEEVFIRIQERAPGSEIGEKASMELGEHYLRRGEMANAATVFDMFLLNYPRSARREQAMLRLIQAHLASFKGPRFDGTALREAVQRLRMYEQEFPAAAEPLGAQGLLARIEESLARKDLLVAKWFQTRREPVSAAAMFQRVVTDWPRTAAARDALGRLEELGSPLSAIAAEPPVEANTEAAP